MLKTFRKGILTAAAAVLGLLCLEDAAPEQGPRMDWCI